METATSQVIGQLSGYMRGLTQRLDSGAGWYGEFLRRDPEGMRACLDGAAMPPWDVLESLLADLAATTGAAALERETRYAAGLRAAAVGIWDRLPGGEEELRTLLASAAEQRARARTAQRLLTARLAEAVDPAEAEALSRELSWTRDDAARATARHEDLAARLEAVTPDGDRPGPPSRPDPLHAVPAQRGTPAAAWPGVRGGARGAEPAGGSAGASGGVEAAAVWPGPREGMRPVARTGSRAGARAEAPAGAAGVWGGARAESWAGAPAEAQGAAPGAMSDMAADRESGRGSDTAPEGAGRPVGRAEGRWLRGARRGGGARYAGAGVEAAGARAVALPPEDPSSATPLRGARFGRPARPAAGPAPAGDPGPEQGAAAGGPAPVAATRPGVPAWSTEHTPGPGSAAAPGPRPHPQGEPAPWPDGASAPTPDTGPPGTWGNPAAGAQGGASTEWHAAASGPGAQGEFGGSASAAGVQGGVSAEWLAAASGPGAHGVPGDPASAAGSQGGASAQWHAPAPGTGVHGGPASAEAPQGAPAPWIAPAPGQEASGGAERGVGDVLGFVEGLVGLRGQGRSGEAHALLCEAAAGPAGQLVRLGEELARAGLAADWATLLWEAASLPPARFAAAAAALGPADREALLRQGVARPAAEIAEAVLVLADAGHTPQADALLAAFVRVRTAEESARLARRDPRWFAPRLLRAAEALSGAHHRDLLHALRVANLPVG
ncbi:hypothetical protein [Streptomyces sp. TBY4]|uniref:hypothetical protein n=1 Tax=Streptomyces sp. TBY4 TaxID=2962030 RepID=UPI0020B89124|nr:hypothetical protein [Streptomyces sp. TBY4]MCP3754054.1 hypothetical protein [Streptomyces sp. TBY4]